MTAVASPCIRECHVETPSRTCRGCGRTLDEIAAWPSLADSEKRRVLARLEAARGVAGA